MQNCDLFSRATLSSFTVAVLFAVSCLVPQIVQAQSAPGVTTLPVTNINNLSGFNATAQASVNPNGAGTTVYFQYSPDLSFSNISVSVFLSAGSSPVQVS